jgi:hypothetical protein
VSVEYDFDAQGRGTATIRRSDGVACNGRAVASSTATGKLRILDGGSLPCSDGSYFKPAEIVCDSSDGDAKCRGAYGSNQPFDIQIQREAR